MSRVEKLLQRVRNNPAQVSFADIDLLLRHAGFELRKAVGSHYQYRKKGYETISIPYRRPHIKAVYVRKVLTIIELVASAEDKRE